MKALADLVEVSAASISQYESYTYEPSEETVERIAYVLGFPMTFFYGRELSIPTPESVTFRSQRSMTAKLRGIAECYSTVAIDLVSPAIRSKFRLPNVDVPDLSEYQPEQAANALRAYWKLGQGPIGNMVHLLESKGVEVYWINEDSPSVSAFSRWKDKLPYIFLNSHSPSGERGRFDAAHELAHLVIHQNVSDTDSRIVEAEADTFASAFLLPSDQFRSERRSVVTLRDYLPLKQRWGVSIAAMVRRSWDINAITKWQYECAFREISTHGWRKQEPGMLSREQSHTHEVVISKLLEKMVTPEEFANTIGVHIKYVEALMPAITKYHDRQVTVKDEYSLSMLRVVDNSIRSEHLGLTSRLEDTGGYLE